MKNKDVEKYKQTTQHYFSLTKKNQLTLNKVCIYKIDFLSTIKDRALKRMLEEAEAITCADIQRFLK